MSDEELDRDWKPNGRRPQSTMARSFSQELMDIFRIENSISDLDKDVNTRKQVVDKGNDELASLEARIREMEERLQRSKTPAGNTTTNTSSTRPPIPTGAPPPPPQQASASAAAKDDDAKARSRPGTARAAQQAPSSGNMPPTPGASEGEYRR